jgi:hypothetical protein
MDCNLAETSEEASGSTKGRFANFDGGNVGNKE